MFQYITWVQNLGSKEDVLGFIGKLTANGGTDMPEALLDGLYDAVYNITWRENSERIIVLLSDAPPHGREFVNHAALAKRKEGLTSDDLFPDGCPCGKTVDPILQEMENKNISLFIMKLGEDMDRMIDIF